MIGFEVERGEVVVPCRKVTTLLQKSPNFYLDKFYDAKCCIMLNIRTLKMRKIAYILRIFKVLIFNMIGGYEIIDLELIRSKSKILYRYFPKISINSSLS